MDISKTDRATLKAYFKKNAVPTETNFGELIDGMLNQKDDGIAKLPGDPLSIAAVGNSAGPQKVINFYSSFSDSDPAWTLQLNPLSDQNNPASAKAGFSVSDGLGNSKLFIDKATGNIGVGTNAPAHKVQIGDNVGGLGFDNGSSPNAGFLRFGDNSGWKLHFGRAKESSAVTAFNTDTTGVLVTIQDNGNVGIGTITPPVKLSVIGNALVSNGNHYANLHGYMPSGSLTIGGINSSFGGGNSWNSNTAGLLLETLKNTEIAVHDYGTRVASLMYYEGEASNRITIGRDMGWGQIGSVVINGAIYATHSDLYFTDTQHKHSGLGNAAGNAAIENAADYDALMILGRAGTDKGRKVKLWDYLQINGGLEVTGNSSLNSVTTNTINLGGFTESDVDEWPKVTWYRDTNKNWDEGLIKHSSSKGFFGRAGFGIHIHESRDWGIWSTGWTPLLGIQGGTGNVQVRGGLKSGGVITPSAGASEANGILFPKDPFGGGGDAAWLRYYARSGESCTLELGISNDGDDHIALMSSGNVGIGVNTPQASLDIHQKAPNSGIRLRETNASGVETGRSMNIAYEGQGNVHFYHQNSIGQWMGPNGTWNLNSDTSLKQEVIAIENILDEVLRLVPVHFKWRHDNSDDFGFIAQDVEQVFPQLVSSVIVDGEERKGLPYATFGVLAIAAIKDLVRTYEQRIQSLESKLQSLL